MKNPIAADTKTGIFSDGEEEWGAGIVPNTFGYEGEDAGSEDGS